MNFWILRLCSVLLSLIPHRLVGSVVCNWLACWWSRQRHLPTGKGSLLFWPLELSICSISDVVCHPLCRVVVRPGTVGGKSWFLDLEDSHQGWLFGYTGFLLLLCRGNLIIIYPESFVYPSQLNHRSTTSRFHSDAGRRRPVLSVFCLFIFGVCRELHHALLTIWQGQTTFSRRRRNNESNHGSFASGKVGPFVANLSNSQ